MARNDRCGGGQVFSGLSPDDLDKLREARESGISWQQLATALRASGWPNATAEGLSRHDRGGCACERKRKRADMIDTGLTFSPPPASRA